MDWRVDAGRRIRERIVHGNEKVLGARARRGYRVALRVDLWFHDAASNNSELRNRLFTVLSYYYAMLLRRRDKASEEFSFSAREFFIISLVRRRPKMLEV